MRKPLFCALLVFLAAILPVNCVAQQTVQRDASAIQFLAQAVQAAGGQSPLAAIQDFTALGTITQSSGVSSPQEGQVTIKALGLLQFRMDSAVPQGISSLIINNGRGEFIFPNGAKSDISYANVANMDALTLPAKKIAFALSSSSIAVLDMGLVQLRGIQVRQIRIQQTFPTDPTGVFSKLATQDFFFDPNTALILETQDYLQPDNAASSVPVLHVVDFAQYQTASGLVVPLSIAETVNGQMTWRVQLSSIVFDTGLSESDFEF